jgi:hypothetical protein
MCTRLLVGPTARESRPQSVANRLLYVGPHCISVPYNGLMGSNNPVPIQIMVDYKLRLLKHIVACSRGFSLALQKAPLGMPYLCA